MTLNTHCPMSGRYHETEIPLTVQEFRQAEALWHKGTLIQNAFPTLNPDQREFIQTGLHPDFWR